MSYGQPSVDQLLQGINADFEMPFYIICSNFSIALFGFYSLRYHGLIAYKQQGAGGNFIIETNRKNGGGLHVNSIGSYFLQVLFKFFIMLPHAAVGSIYSACPVINSIVTNSG